MELRVDISGMENLILPLKTFPKELEKALRQSLKRTGVHMASQVSKAIKAESYLKSGDIRAALGKPLIKGDANYVEAEVRVSGKQSPIDKFKLLPNRATAKKGVRSEKWRGPSYRLGPSVPVITPGASGGSKPFVALARGKKRLMRRFGKNLKIAYGYSVQYFAVFERVRKASLDDSQEFF